MRILPRDAGEVARRAGGGKLIDRRVAPSVAPRQLPRFAGEHLVKTHPTFTPVIEIAANTSSVKKLTASPFSCAPST